MRILIAEDDVKAAGLLVEGLKAEGYAVDLARDGEEAMWLAETHPYDVMVFDVMMPAKDGFTVVRHCGGRTSRASHLPYGPRRSGGSHSGA